MNGFSWRDDLKSMFEYALSQKRCVPGNDAAEWCGAPYGKVPAVMPGSAVNRSVNQALPVAPGMNHEQQANMPQKTTSQIGIDSENVARMLQSIAHKNPECFAQLCSIADAMRTLKHENDVDGKNLNMNSIISQISHKNGKEKPEIGGPGSAFSRYSIRDEVTEERPRQRPRLSTEERDLRMLVNACFPSKEGELAREVPRHSGLGNYARGNAPLGAHFPHQPSKGCMDGGMRDYVNGCENGNRREHENDHSVQYGSHAKGLDKRTIECLNEEEILRNTRTHYGAASQAMDSVRQRLVASFGAPKASIERKITNSSYLVRFNVTADMAMRLFPLPPPESWPMRPRPEESKSVFKHDIHLIDRFGREYTVRYEGIISSGQRHNRLTTGWCSTARSMGLDVGDVLVLERWTDDRTKIHVWVKRQGVA